jgi:[protein-PII] uridylyltransferase
LLFHDIGKGRGGDHSQKGAEIATSLAPRFKLSSQETSDLSWLVLYHQTMSQTAFQRDVYDPKTIEDFSKLVKTKQRLYMLFALTCADILAVGPNVWSEWKKSLLIELFKRTLKKITGAQEEEKQTIKEKKKQIQESLKNDISRDVLDNILNIGSHNYWLSFNIETIKSHVKNLFNKEKKDDWIYFYFNDDEKKNITELTVYTKDYSGVFSKIAGALSISNASIIDAKIITLKDKTILDSFYIQESKNNKIGNVKNFDKFISSKKKKQNIIENITNAVFNKLDLEEKISKKLANNKQRIRKISEKPNVKIDNKGSKDHSLLEIGADDKIGLLYSITSIISSLGLQISSAQISTYGTRAYDVFYIKDKSGMKITDKKQIDIIKTRITENL